MGGQDIKKHVNLVDDAQVKAHRLHGARLPKRALHLSFDDGFAECYSVARPLAASAGSARRAHGVDVEDQHTDDFAETQGDDGQIISTQPQGGNADQQPGQCGGQGSTGDGDQQ